MIFCFIFFVCQKYYLDQEVKTYLNYYSHVPNGPFVELAASNPRLVYKYAKAAEQAVEQYNNKYQVFLHKNMIKPNREHKFCWPTFQLYLFTLILTLKYIKTKETGAAQKDSYSERSTKNVLHLWVCRSFFSIQNLYKFPSFTFTLPRRKLSFVPISKSETTFSKLF